MEFAADQDLAEIHAVAGVKGDRADKAIDAIAGMKRLSANGLRYPIPQYGIQSDARAGLAVSYGER